MTNGVAPGHTTDCHPPRLTRVPGNLYFNVPVPVGTLQAYMAAASEDSCGRRRGFGPGTAPRSKVLPFVCIVPPNHKQRVFDAKLHSCPLLSFPTRPQSAFPQAWANLTMTEGRSEVRSMTESPLGPMVQPLRGMGFFCSGLTGPTLSFSVPLEPWVELQS